MTIYKVGDMDYSLEDIIAIGKTYGWDANRIRVHVWLRNCVEKTECTIDAVGEERNNDSTGGMDGRFRERAYKEFDNFRAAWADANKKQAA